MPELDALLRIAREAGELILRVYRQDFQVNQKNDQSPVTEADMAAHHHILAELTRLTPQIPVLSEESAEQVGPERMDWQRYWLVDPLDGTREFIKRQAQRRIHRQHRPDRQRHTGAWRSARPGAGYQLVRRA